MKAAEIFENVKDLRPRRRVIELNNAAVKVLYKNSTGWHNEPNGTFLARKWIFDDGSAIIEENKKLRIEASEEEKQENRSFTFDPNTGKVSIPELYVPANIKISAKKLRRKSTVICVETSEPHPYKDAVLKPAGAEWDDFYRHWTIHQDRIPILIELSKEWAKLLDDAGMPDVYKKGV